jgi:DNA uptake protein ComE-like DNA-binding protein
MAWRSFAIRTSLVLCLLFGTGAFAKKKPPAQPVNVNTANSEQLQTVPGIGPATAPAQ